VELSVTDEVRGSAVDGDFRAWVEPHLVSMGRLAARLTSIGDADDIVQEALVRAWKRRSTFDPNRGNPQAWLLAIVADRSRRHRTRSRATVELIDSAAAATHVEASLDLERAIRELSGRQRLAIELHYLIGLGVRECAAVMSCSEGTVKSTLYDARLKLRHTLQEVSE
jgi:RNA polymerase sigma factor (sigma-70 family)